MFEFHPTTALVTAGAILLGLVLVRRVWADIIGRAEARAAARERMAERIEAVAGAFQTPEPMIVAPAVTFAESRVAERIRRVTR